MNGIDVDWAWREFEPTDERPWDRKAASHLFRRAGFGADLATVDAAVKRTPAQVVHELIDASLGSAEFEKGADVLAETTLAGGDSKKLAAAWVYRLMHSPLQLREKMTLFWHGHFATGADKVTDSRMMWNQNKLLREHALGNFGALVEKISQDPAMLIYLDSAINRKAHPNENFARELMELFCLGEGNYSESDVLELARCFTGWEIKSDSFRKNRYQHDVGVKRFLNQQGNFDGEDGVRVVLEQPSVERFIARKLYRFFISDEPQPADELLQPLANEFRRNGLEIAPLLKMLLGSNLFFSQYALGRKIKSPVELAIGTLRSLRATTNAQLVANGLLEIGQGLFYPPNVKGWDGGRAWINSSTLLGRANLIADVLSNEATRFGGLMLAPYLESLNVHTNAETLDHYEQLLLASPLNSNLKSQLLEAADSSSNDKERRLRSLLHAVTSQPSGQLG